MATEILSLISACQWDSVQFLFISKNVFDPLIYYSHLFPLAAAFILVIFLYIESSKILATKILLATTFLLGIWLLGDLILWATDKPSVTIYVWTIINMIEPMIYAGFLYFLYLFIDQKDISFLKKLIIILLLTPTVVLASTKFAMFGYDISNCDRDAVEGPLVYYGYFVECVFILWMLLFAIKNYIKRKADRKKIIFITFGSLGFLIAFAFGNVIGSLFDAESVFGDYSWTIGQYGIFGIPIFLFFLTYVIVKYKTFNIKIFGAQVLVVGLMILIGSQFFFIRTNINRVLTGITLIISTIFGIFLVRSVKREVEQREHIEKLAESLEKANEKLKELDQMKSEFLSLATHQIRAPLTAIKGYASMLLEGDFGELPLKIRRPAKTILTSCQHLVDIVEDFLNISRIEQGRMVYNKENFDLKNLVKETVEEMKVNIAERDLQIQTEIVGGQILINADRAKLKQVLHDLIDNAIKYTPKGLIKISIHHDREMAEIKIRDSGIGIEAKDIPKLFNKFSRTKEGFRQNISGTGLGLYISQKMVEAHNGWIEARSEGKNKGSVFVVKLPLATPV